MVSLLFFPLLLILLELLLIFHLDMVRVTLAYQYTIDILLPKPFAYSPKSNSSRCAPQARYAGEKRAAWGDAGVLGAACFPVAPQPSTLHPLVRGATAW